MKVLLAILLLTLAIGHEVMACGCSGVLGLADAVHVFEGEVISIRRFDSATIYYEITFKTTKNIKGVLFSDNMVVVVPSLQEAACGIPFEIKEKYVVYTYIEKIEGKERAYTSLCTETRKIP